MFNTKLPVSANLADAALYFAQLIISYPLVMLAGIPFLAALSWFGFSGEHGKEIYFAGYRILVCLLSGSLVGWLIGQKVPQFVATGRWIWVLPSVFMFRATIFELRGSQAIPYLPDLFFATSNNERLGVYLFALPFFSATGYSMGMALVGKKFAAVGGLFLAIILTMLVPVAHDFEKTRLDAWSRTKFVIDPHGVPFSRDPTVLCESGYSGVVLIDGSALQAIEQRNCGPHGMLEVGEPSLPGMWGLRRVKLLDGPSAGTEGWILDYGLR